LVVYAQAQVGQTAKNQVAKEQALPGKIAQ
jgi:hypothetical protein